MNRTPLSSAARWKRALLLSALACALAFACVASQLTPQPGLVEVTALARVPVPGGHVNAAGGNYFHERVDLALDTRLGPFAIGAVYNSARGWTSSVDVTYVNGSLRDATGAHVPLAALASGEAAPGTHWVKLDAARVKTKGGLVHEFDAASGRLIAIHYASASYPRLRFVQQQLGAQWRTRAVEQCTSASACAVVFALAYDAGARLVRIDDRAGRSALFAYDAAGKLASARGGLDVAKGWAGERYAYAGAFLSAITSSEDERIEIASDALGRALEVRAIGAGDPCWRFAYGLGTAAGLYTTTATDPLGQATVYAIDASRRVQSVTNPLGERTDFTWSGVRPASRTLPDGTRTLWSWADDDLASETTPSGNVRRFFFHAAGVDRARPLARPLLEARDAVGLIERRGYDASGRLVRVANGQNEETTLRYGDDETLLGTTDPSGTRLRFAATGEHGWPTLVSFGDATDAAVASYDAVGNRLRSTAPDPQSGGVTQRGYDEDRNLAVLEVVDAPASGAPVVRTIAQEFRSDGQRLRTLRPYGGATTFAYDALGRLVAISEQASPGATAQPGAGGTTTIARDLSGRVTAIERANGMREELAYDAAGRISRRRTLRDGVLETDVAFEFAAGRLVRAHAAGDFDETFAYDAAGRVREVTHALGETTRFAYDERSRPTLTAFVLQNGAPLATLAHTYDFADRELSLAYLGANLIARTFAGGRVERTHYGNGVRQDHFRSTESGRSTGRELWRGSRRIEKSDYAFSGIPGGAISQLRSEVSDGGGADGVSQEDFSYAAFSAQNGMERRVASTFENPSGGPAERLHYDALSNFTGGAARGMAESVAYNAERNRVLAAVHLQGGAPYEPAPTSTFASDAAGFVTEESFALGGVPLGSNAFTWNARGQIAAIRSDGAVTASFEYDALGRRSARVVAGVLKRWRFGGVVEADASGRAVAIDLGEVRIDLAGQHRYRHHDLRGNPKHVTSAAGRVVRHNLYGAYGQASARGPQADDVGFAGGTPIATPRGSYVLLGSRLLAPMLARFLAPDPIWSPINQYAYTLGNPVDFWDPGGLHAGSHHDLIQAQLGVATAVLTVVASAIALATAPVAGPALPILALNLQIALLNLADAILELDQELRRHDELSLDPRLDTERSGGGEGASVSGRRRTRFGGGGDDWRFEVCSDDGLTSMCTRTRGSSWAQPPRFVLY